MAQIAMVFAGQGAQTPGMGLPLAAASPAAREVFRRVDELRPGTSEQCFSGSAEELARTVNTQPCLWAVEMAAAAALEESGVQVQKAAGFSLGEIAALTYTGAVDFETGFRLVCERAACMDAAAQQADSAMAAVLKLDAATVEKLCAEYAHVWPVNYNCPGQITVAGLRQELAQFAQTVKDAGGLARMLKVSGAFHSPLMSSAATEFAQALDQADLAAPALPLYSNYTGLPYGGDARDLLEKQICHPVRWQSIVEHMAADGVDTFVEVGPGKTLSSLIARTLPDVRTLHVSDADTLAETLGVLKYA